MPPRRRRRDRSRAAVRASRGGMRRLRCRNRRTVVPSSGGKIVVRARPRPGARWGRAGAGAARGGQARRSKHPIQGALRKARRRRRHCGSSSCCCLCTCSCGDSCRVRYRPAVAPVARSRHAPGQRSGIRWAQPARASKGQVSETA